MKKLFYLLFISFVLFACSSTKKTSQQNNLKQLKGENEMFVLKAMGTPTQVRHTRDGKVLVYENHEAGTFLSPNKSNFAVDNDGWTYTSNVNKKTNKSQYTITSSASSTVRIYIDNKGKCVKIEQTPMGEYGEMYHERFKHFNTER